MRGYSSDPYNNSGLWPFPYPIQSSANISVETTAAKTAPYYTVTLNAVFSRLSLGRMGYSGFPARLHHATARFEWARPLLINPLQPKRE